jgi:CBS domain-containing protein
MSDPNTVVVKIASSPAQAKIFVALLQGEGIPAFVDGDSLTDEFAMSRKLMNLAGVKVMVPKSSLEQAKKVLEATDVDAEDLERQALAAGGEGERVEREAPTRPPAAPGSLARPAAFVGIAAAFVFFLLWQNAANAAPSHPLYTYEHTGTTLREYLRRTGELLRTYEDVDKDGAYERIVYVDPDRRLTEIADQMDRNGNYGRIETRLADGTVILWTRSSDATTFDRIVVTTKDGTVLQTLVWQDGRGFVDAR